MIHLGLIGYPLGHSLSPKLHATAFKACGLQGDYSLFSIEPDDIQGLKNLLDRVRAKEIHGLNVTIPHKQNVIQFMQELTPTAQAIGAMNTICLKDDRLIGDNTDAPGFLADLKRFLALECDRLPSHMPEQAPVLQKNALVLGAGGSARAVVYALLNEGWHVTVSARRIKQAQELAHKFKYIKVVEFNMLTFQHANAQLVVNTTPLGMTPNKEQSPWPHEIPFPKNAALYDLVYNPRETVLVQQARTAGLQATTGLGMLIEQAALAFEIWTGRVPSRELMRASVE